MSLDTGRRRVALAAAAVGVFSSIVSIRLLVGWLRNDWGGGDWYGIDGSRMLVEARRLLDGEALYQDPAYLYTPLATLLTVPLAMLTISIALAWGVVIRAAVLAIATWVATRHAPVIERWIATGATGLWLPTVHDHMLGNTTVFVVVALWLAVDFGDRARNGIALGLALAAVPKPFLLPFLPWLMVWKPRTAVGAASTAAVATIVTAAALGPMAYVEFLGSLIGGLRFAGFFPGNVGLTASHPELLIPLAATVAILSAAILLRRGRIASLAWMAGAGLVASPYLGYYSMLPLLVAAVPLARLAPRRTLVLAALSIVAPFVSLPLYGLVVLITALTLREPGPTGFERLMAAVRPATGAQRIRPAPTA